MQIDPEKWQHPAFEMVSTAADVVGCRCYVIGGYVRDALLGRPSTDIDIVCDGSGIALAQEVKRLMGRGAHLSVFKNFGTAQIKKGNLELEFVGARKESYRADSRKPIVEDGTIEDDQRRRDFTINALAISLCGDDYGELIDPFGGIKDLNDKLIRTPLEPDRTFSDDPLRMMRAVRFASQLGFGLVPETFESIRRMRGRIKIVSAERITTELNKILLSPRPSLGLRLMDECGLMELILPELSAMKGVEVINGRGHKDVFYHSLAVTDNVAAESDKLYLRWAALLHDVGKPATKRYDERLGWTFHNHNYVGSKIAARIFRRLKLPLTDPLRYVQKMVNLHMRPIALVEEKITDSAVRRLLFEAGDDIDDLMLLCRADITTKNAEKQKLYKSNMTLVEEKMHDIEQKDHVRNFQPPVDGTEIMEAFGLEPCHEIGVIKNAIKEAILEGEIPNEHAPARELMFREGAKLGLKPIS